jgi:hypothetical protein
MKPDPTTWRTTSPASLIPGARDYPVDAGNKLMPRGTTARNSPIILKTHHLKSGEDLEQTLLRYAMLYNEHLPQAALHSRTPMDAMKTWYAFHSKCFNRPSDSTEFNRPECNTY